MQRQKRDWGNYVRYHWWKYAVLLVLSLIVWNVVFTMTAPRPEENEKLDLIFCAGTMDIYSAERMTEEISEFLPDMEQVNFLYAPVDGEAMDDYVYQIQYTVYISTQQGDILFVSRERFDSLMEETEISLPLDEYAQLGDLPLITSGDKAVAVDISSLKGLTSNFGFDPTDCVAFLPYYCSNPEESAEVIAWMFERYGE